MKPPSLKLSLSQYHTALRYNHNMAIDFSQYKTAEAPIQPSSAQTNFNGLSNDTSLSASTLAPTQSISIPPAPPENSTSSFESELELLAKSTNTAKKEENQSFNDLLASLNAPGSAELTNQAYGANNGVDQLQLELNDINSQILAEQEGLRRQIEEIQDRGGMTVSGAKSTIDAARRKSLRTQADLAIIQMSKQGRYDSAKAVADRAVSAILEKQKNQQQLRMMAYERSKEAFSKSEQREFEFRQKERDRQLENEEYRLRLAFDAKIKQSDPLYQANLANARLEGAKLRQQLAPAPQLTPLKAAKVKNQVFELRNLSTSSALSGAVGPNRLARSDPSSFFTGSKQNFIGSIEQLREGLTLDTLQQAKANGATFGGLSDGERITLAAAATKIGSWAVKNKNGEVTGYNVDELSFKKELDTINNFARLDYILRGGDPTEVGVTVTPDGAMWVENTYDGNLTQIQ